MKFSGMILLLLGGSRAAKVAVGAFGVGVLLFSGSLWAMALTGLRPLGAVTPFGGVALLGGWLALGLAGAQLRRAAPTKASGECFNVLRMT